MKTVNSIIFIQSVEFELPNVYTVSSVFPHPISIFTTNEKRFKIPTIKSKFEKLNF